MHIHVRLSRTPYCTLVHPCVLHWHGPSYDTHLLPRPLFALPCPPPLTGLGRWDEAVECFGRAAALAPNFAFASANQALAMYQVGGGAVGHPLICRKTACWSAPLPTHMWDMSAGFAGIARLFLSAIALALDNANTGGYPPADSPAIHLA